MSGHFGTFTVVPKCLRSEVSWVRSVLTPPPVPPRSQQNYVESNVEFSVELNLNLLSHQISLISRQNFVAYISDLEI